MNMLSNYSVTAVSYAPDLATVHKQVWQYI